MCLLLVSSLSSVSNAGIRWTDLGVVNTIEDDDRFDIGGTFGVVLEVDDRLVWRVILSET